LEDEVKQLEAAEILKTAYQRKKLLLWFVRNVAKNYELSGKK
jgi:hypothetical protein